MAIEKLVQGLEKNLSFQTLLGVTGSGKTFSMANVIAAYQMPALVIAHNKTLANQLYQEFRDFFPHNRVEYFVSYYDYYQPESYIPQRDQYIEKDSQINAKIEQMRLSATASLLSHQDVIVVASVSCIYSVGNPADMRLLSAEFFENQIISRNELLEHLFELQYERNQVELKPGRYRVKGDTVDIIPGNENDIIRLSLFGNTIERIQRIDRLNQSLAEVLPYYHLFPAKHFVIPEVRVKNAIESIKAELFSHLPTLEPLEAQRLKQRTLYDMEMIEETGSCKGIENYSRHFDGRSSGQRPYCLIDYFPENFLLILDESHQTIPQLHAMYKGDYSRKKNLIDYGFRLPSAYDNRPLKFAEFETFMNQARIICTSATPGPYEMQHSQRVIEQIIRPTGLLDPVIEVRPSQNQMTDLLAEIRQTIDRGDRVMVTTLTKKMAEELADFFSHKNIKTRYLHSEIDTLDRNEIIREFRLGVFDILVGINLLREGLDIPEIGLIAILDADKEGFLRDSRSLIQIIGRAARNIHAKVILYADRQTDSMRTAIFETERRRKMQLEYNQQHGITPKTIQKPIKEKQVEIKDIHYIPKNEIPNAIIELTDQMMKAAEKLDFESAIALREKIKKLNLRLNAMVSEKG
jgi:excinuclease ABC subunit B